jgi:hypothetical protein
MAVNRALGLACAFDDQCASQRCSADMDSGSCGSCVDPRKLGERCDGPQQGCSVTASCVGGVCKSTRKNLGEACAVGVVGECDPIELYCAEHAGFAQGACVARIPVGGSCAGIEDSCVVQAICGENKVCTIPAANSCQGGCAVDTFCGEDRTCKPSTLAPGARCGLVNGAFVGGCAPGTVCGNLEFPDGHYGSIDTCLALPVEGDPCIMDRCAEGLYCKGAKSRRCERLLSEGEACRLEQSRLSDCAAGLECRGRVCKIACD